MTTTDTLDLEFSIDGVSAALRVVALDGREAMSELFAFQVTLALDDEREHLDGIVGRKATLRTAFAGRARAIHGVVSRSEEEVTDGANPAYRVTLSPAAVVLQLRHDCRVFQDRSAPEIIERVLGGSGLAPGEHRAVLHAGYLRHEQRAQYRESDWAFLMRLLEAEGMVCFFEQGDDREVLVVADTPFAHARIAEPSSLPYRRANGATATGEHVHRFRVADALRPGSVELRGHSFERPELALASVARDGGGAPDPPASGDHAIVIHDAPPAFGRPEVGDKLARLRLEQENAARRVAHGAGASVALRPGHVFRLVASDRAALDRDWLVTSAEHHATAPATGAGSAPRYECRFTCIPADVPFRSPARTPPPVVRGLQTAVVVGPPGETIHCDALGRVKVQLRWDREGRFDDNSSCWVRVSQAWAGRGHGALFTPRVGDEVLVDFLDGDVDRPIVVGSVYDAVNVPPASLPRDRTTTALRSSSLPDGEGRSELRFEDKPGAERVHVDAYRDLRIAAGQDRDEGIGRDDAIHIGRDRAATVAGNDALEVGQARSVAVAGAQSVSVAGDEATDVGGTSSLTVGAARALEVGGDHTTTVAGQRTEVIGRRLTLRVGGDKDEKVAGSSREAVDGERSLAADRVSLDVESDLRAVVAGNHEERARFRRIGADEVLEIACGEATITAHQDGTVTIAGKNVSVKVAGRVEVEADKLSVKTQGAVNVSAGGAVKLRGRGLSFN